MVPSFTNSATQGGEPVLLDSSDPMPPSPAPRWLILHLISLSSSSFTLLPLWASLLLLTYSVSLVSRFSCFQYCTPILMTSIYLPDYSQSESSIRAKIAFTSCLCVPGTVLETWCTLYILVTVYSYTHLPSEETKFHRWWYPDSWALEQDPLWLSLFYFY